MHAWDLAKSEIDVSKHSALLACGGDGTIHEVVNGLLTRPDKQLIPVLIVPNGSGNDTAACFGLKTVEQALEWLIKGDVIRVDINKVLLDAEHEDEIADEVKSNRFRYSFSSSSSGFVAKCVHKSISHKKYVGNACYKTSAIANVLTSETECQTMILEDKDGCKTELQDEHSFMLCVMNGKFGGTGIYFAPVAILNDGLFDLVFHHGPAPLSAVIEFIQQGINGGGQHIYLDNFAYFRGKKFTFHNRNFLDLINKTTSPDVPDDQRPKKLDMQFQIDGEALTYKETVIIEVVPEAVPIVVNLEEMFSQDALFHQELKSPKL